MLGSDDVGVDGVAVLEKDSARRISTMSDKEKYFLDTVWTDKVQVVFNFLASFETLNLCIKVLEPSLI